MDYRRQENFDLRFEWGVEGVTALAPNVKALVIVDVLSFSTTVDIAVSRGASVYPHRMSGDTTAAELARDLGATLAVRRSEADAASPFSLSPGSMQNASQGQHIVLPSPNGATLSMTAAEYDIPVFAGCLRNAAAVAAACRECGAPIAVIAAGERWAGDSGGLRPAIEDLIGAGAILAALDGFVPSPEAAVAIAAFRTAEPDLRAILERCSSGRELIAMGHPEDVAFAAELNVSECVPRLVDGAYGR